MPFFRKRSKKPSFLICFKFVLLSSLTTFKTTELCCVYVNLSKTKSFSTKEPSFFKNAFFWIWFYFCSSHNFFHNGPIDPSEVSMASYGSLVFILQPFSTTTFLYEAADCVLLKYIGLLTNLAGDWVTSSPRPKKIFRSLGASRAQRDPEPH